MKFDKKILTIIIILVFLIILTIVALIFLSENENNNEIENTESNNILPPQEVEEVISEENDVTNIEIYKVRDCISIYLSAINRSNPVYESVDSEGNLLVSEEMIAENIIPLLSSNYIQSNGINTTNVFNYVDNINNNAIFDILNIKRSIKNNSYQYVVYGVIEDTDYNFIKYAYYIVYLNITDNVFAIEPILTNIDNIDSIEAEDIEVEKNGSNDMPTFTMTQENLARERFNTYKRLMLSMPELAYEYLDDNYKQEKFGDINVFIEYINDNKEEILSARLNEYKTTNYDNYTQYACLDQNNNYYIFNETEPMQYKVLLDTYTVDLQEFVDRYEQLPEAEKARTCIERVFEAINNNDYKYVYNKLDETYRNNNFHTETDFENYMKTNFFEKNSISNNSYEKNEDLYVYKLTIINASNTTQTVEKQFVVKLLDGTDFVMSFSI